MPPQKRMSYESTPGEIYRGITTSSENFEGETKIGVEKESDYVSYKVNAGERQESIKFPAEYRDKINEVLFPKYADDMKLLHKNYEVLDGQ